MFTRRSVQMLSFEEASAAVDHGAAFVDLRPIESYLEVHIRGSLALLYEFGPGMVSRARDCLPLGLPLVLLDLGHGDLANAAASLRGKGFTVLGRVADGINQWAAAGGSPVSTEIVARPEGRVLDVGDPGAHTGEDSLRIPIEVLWGRASELNEDESITVASGFGVRAALAVGILERFGHDVSVWDARARP
jgi:rhodanese-related sulfurtransferase